MDSSNGMVTNLTFEGWETSVQKEIKERLTKPKTPLEPFFKIKSEVRLGDMKKECDEYNMRFQK